MDRNICIIEKTITFHPSLSARRAWIEIFQVRTVARGLLSLSARRAWIEINASRLNGAIIIKSLSARRAWIEMILEEQAEQESTVALRKESVDRNDFPIVPVELTTLSLSARRAWIEMTLTVRNVPIESVALRKESVDRNDNGNPVAVSDLVALRKESVDRNFCAV